MSTKIQKTEVAPLTPEQTEKAIEERLRGYVSNEVDSLVRLRREFFEAFERSSAEAIQWHGSELVSQEAAVKLWEMRVLCTLNEDKPLVDRLSTIFNRVRYDQEQMIRRRPWEANSTSPFANVVQSAQVSGQAEVFYRITTVVDIALSQLRGRPESE